MSSLTSTLTRCAQVLVWSAASGVGHWLTQLVHLAGLQVFATASPKHTERLKALGVVEVFDYRDPKAGANIHAATSGKLAYVGVCEAKEADVPNIVASMGSDTQAAAVAFLESPASTDVKFATSITFTLFGEVRNVLLSVMH